MSYVLEYLPWSPGSSDLIAVHLSLLISIFLFPLVSVDRSARGALFLNVCGPKGVGMGLYSMCDSISTGGFVGRVSVIRRVWSGPSAYRSASCAPLGQLGSRQCC